MYQVEMRLPGKAAWFPIWGGDDGHDAADYLRQCVEGDGRPGVEHRMRYVRPAPTALGRGGAWKPGDVPAV